MTWLRRTGLGAERVRVDSPLSPEDALAALRAATAPQALGSEGRFFGVVGDREIRLGAPLVRREEHDRLRLEPRFVGRLMAAGAGSALEGEFRTALGSRIGIGVGVGLVVLATLGTVLAIAIEGPNLERMAAFGFALVVGAVLLRGFLAMPEQGHALRHRLLRELHSVLGAGRPHRGAG